MCQGLFSGDISVNATQWSPLQGLVGELPRLTMVDCNLPCWGPSASRISCQARSEPSQARMLTAKQFIRELVFHSTVIPLFCLGDGRFRPGEYVCTAGFSESFPATRDNPGWPFVCYTNYKCRSLPALHLT